MYNIRNQFYFLKFLKPTFRIFLMPDIFKKPSPTSSALPPAANTTQPPIKPPLPLNKVAGLAAMPPHHFRLSSFFKSMFEKPDGVSFINQEADESIILLLHASFFTNALWILFTIVFIFLPPFLFPFFSSIGLDLVTVFSPSALSIVILSYYLFIFGYAYVNYISWFYNVSIVSNLHVLDIDFANMSYKKVSTVTITEIADVSYTQAGFFQTFFDFGTVKIDPQEQNNSIFFENIPKPSYVTDLILDLKEGTPDNA